MREFQEKIEQEAERDKQKALSEIQMIENQANLSQEEKEKLKNEIRA